MAIFHNVPWVAVCIACCIDSLGKFIPSHFGLFLHTKFASCPNLTVSGWFEGMWISQFFPIPKNSKRTADQDPKPSAMPPKDHSSVSLRAEGFAVAAFRGLGWGWGGWDKPSNIRNCIWLEWHGGGASCRRVAAHLRDQARRGWRCRRLENERWWKKLRWQRSTAWCREDPLVHWVAGVVVKDFCISTR